MKTIRVLFFATLKDKIGAPTLELGLPENSRVAELLEQLGKSYPACQPLLANSLISVNQQYAFMEDVLPQGAEVAIFPPVSGGDSTVERPTWVKVTYEALDLDDLVKRITRMDTGAVCTFTGIVRGETHRGDPHETLSLEYEAYIPMAEAKMAQIAQEIRARWPEVQGVAMVQRIGLLEPQTPTVFVACAAAHRDVGVFEAAHYGIDRLKEIVPVWKKEIGPNGQAWVEGEYHPQRGD